MNLLTNNVAIIDFVDILPCLCCTLYIVNPFDSHDDGVVLIWITLSRVYFQPKTRGLFENNQYGYPYVLLLLLLFVWFLLWKFCSCVYVRLINSINQSINLAPFLLHRFKNLIFIDPNVFVVIYLELFIEIDLFIENVGVRNYFCCIF